MKYVAHVRIDQKHKYHLLTKLTYTQYYNFLELFNKNKEQAEYILFKKLYKLFDTNDLDEYKEKELIKLYKITEIITLTYAIQLFRKINYQNLTVHNAKKLLLFLRDENDFKTNKLNVEWGPGNNNNNSDNIKNHFNKHVLSNDEGTYWKTILSEINYDTYANFAINVFYKMINVIVHTDGTKVYLSGFYGNVFIVGRYHNDTFGISSCYYVENGEKNGRYNGICFELKF